MKKILFPFALLVLAVGGYFLFRPQTPTATQSIFDCLVAKEPIQLTLEADLGILMEDKDTSSAYQDATLRIQKPSRSELCLPVKVKSRGVFRKAICEFPPLKFKFSEKTLAGEGFKKHNTLKLVTHCKEDPTFDQLVLKEYLAFCVYNLLTEKSFRVQLAKIKYKDSKGVVPGFQRFAFLIESPEELADRLDGRIVEEEYSKLKAVDKAQYKLFTVFQYMVGNTDWSLTNFHNAKIIMPNDERLPMPFPVPYDFDFSGMVDAPYAAPHYSVPISSVKERYFQWRGDKNEDFSDVFALIKSKQKAIASLCHDFKYLNDECRSSVETYLGAFFDMLDAPEAIVGRE